MTLNIDFTPYEAAWLHEQAQQQGLPAAEMIRKMVGPPARHGPAARPDSAHPGNRR